MSWPPALGWAGALLLLAGYLQASRGRWPASGGAFQACTVAGSLGLGAAAAAAGVWSSAALNAVWVLIGLTTLARALRRRPARATPPEDPR